MIGTPFQQLAEKYAMKTAQGVAYGTVGGYAVTFLDGPGCHRIMVTTRFSSPARKDALMEIINAQDLKGLYHIRKLQIAKKVIHIVFKGVPDTMEKIPAFIQWFFPLLEEYGASKAHICVQCQETIAQDDGVWILRDGAVSFRMHRSCAQALKETVAAANGKKATDPEGSLGKGIAGAALGAALGAVLWAMLDFIGFMAPIAGLVIGWLTVFLYGKLGGKQCRLRLPVLILAAALGTGLATLLSAAVAWLENAGSGDLYGNLIMGLFFSALGLFVSLRSANRQNADLVVTELE